MPIEETIHCIRSMSVIAQSVKTKLNYQVVKYAVFLRVSGHKIVKEATITSSNVYQVGIIGRKHSSHSNKL